MSGEPMSSAAGSRVRISAKQQDSSIGRLASPESEAGCGRSMHASFAYYDLDSSSWKTPQRCLPGISDEFSETWPRSGFMLNGIAYRLPPLVPPISGIGCSFLPTPTASGFGARDIPKLLARREKSKEKHGNGQGFGLTLNQWVRLVEWQTTGTTADGIVNPEWIGWCAGFPMRWSEIEDTETPSALSSPSGSAGGLSSTPPTEATPCTASQSSGSATTGGF